MHNNRNCRAICDADVHCTGYVLPVDGSNWCETYTSTGSVGDGRRAFYCYMKDGVPSPHGEPPPSNYCIFYPDIL